MRIIIFIFACVIFFFGQCQCVEEVLTAPSHNKACMDETKITKDRIQKLSANEILAKDRTPEDTKWISCVLQKNDMVDEKGMLNIIRFTKGFTIKTRNAFKNYYNICSRISSAATLDKKNTLVYDVMCMTYKAITDNNDVIIFTTKGI